MKRALAPVFGVLVLACVAASSARAETINLVTQSTLADLFGTSDYVPVTDFKLTDLSNGNMDVDAYSQGFYGNGKYAYLYQLNNTGTPTVNSPVELFTIWPYPGMLAQGELGYLTGTVPASFASGAQAPEPSGFMKQLAGGTQLTFYYTQRYDSQIDPGEASKVMYILSSYGPGTGVTGSAIDGSAATGPVWGPVPEPSMLALLAASVLGLLGCVAWRRASGRGA